MRTLLTRIAALFRSRRLDSDLTEEVAVHLAMLEEEFRARGMSPDQARLAARREFGGVTQMQEAYRDRRGVPWLETSLRDVRYALRGFRRNPGFATAAVLSLALGIGANAAVFSLVYPLLIRSLPVPHPEELVSLYQTGGSDGIASYPLYREFATRTDLFQGVAATVGSGSEVPIGVGPGAAPQLATVEGVSGNYFHTLEVPPALGSVFGGETSEPAAVLSYDFWQRRFAADPRIVGRTIRWRKRSLAVIGVAAPGFYGVHIDRRTDLWLPISSDDFEIENPGADWLRIVARRRPEVPIERIQSAIAVLYAQFARTAFAGYDAPLRNLVMKRRVEARSARAGLSPVRERFGGPLLALLAVVSVVLLLSCANVANLLLARGAARRKETAMRLSLGASRARLVRQALAETAVLAVCGGALGALLAVWGKRYAVQFLPERLGDPFGSGLGGAVLAFALGISLVSAILFGLAPALHSAAVDPAEGLRGAGGDRGRPTFRRTLVAAQIALSVVLVLLAGLFTRSLAALRSVGFRDANVIRFQLVLPPEWKRAEAEAAGKRFRAALASVPGVASVSSGSGPYEIGTTSMGPVRVPGSAKTAVTPALVNMMRVAPRYFETLGSPPVLGREFEPGEGTWPPKAVIVNQEFVREFLPGEKQPVGRGVIFANEKLAQPIPIAGVVGDLPHKGLREKAAPLVYSPGESGAFTVVRLTAPAPAVLPAIRRELAKAGPGSAISDPLAMQQQIDDSIFQDRLLATISGFFGVLALLLAAVGVYGVVAYQTAQRTSEIGVRIALGAERGSVVWLVLRGALVLVVLGLAAGLPAAFAAARAAGAVVFGVKPGDPWLFIGTAAALLAAGAAAAIIPARRASAMDPMRALRHE